jgi:outer membrane protein assembly factor BamB
MMKFKLTPIFLLLVISTAQSQEIAEFRGPGRTGIYPEAGLLKKWPEKGPGQVLKISGFGTGHSQPVVYKNTIFVSGTKDSSNLVSAYSMNGKLLWQTVYGKFWIRTNPENRCTPTIENDRLYIASGIGDISCLNTSTGKILWSVSPARLYQAELHKHGESESLLLTDKAVIYTAGGEKNSIIALNKTNGSIIWKSTSLGGPKSYASPILIERGGLRIILAQTANHLVALNSETGEILWNHNLMQYHISEQGQGANTNPPLVWKNDVFVTSGYNHAAIMLTMADDNRSVSVKWKNEVLDCHLGGVVRINGAIYGSTWENNSKGKWASVDWETGKVNWETDWFNKGPIISAEGLLYIMDEKFGNIALVQPDIKSLRIISTFRVTEGEGPYWTHPAIYNGLLYIRHGDVLMVYNLKA